MQNEESMAAVNRLVCTWSHCFHLLFLQLNKRPQDSGAQNSTPSKGKHVALTDEQKRVINSNFSFKEKMHLKEARRWVSENNVLFRGTN